MVMTLQHAGIDQVVYACILFSITPFEGRRVTWILDVSKSKMSY